eukprot:3304311-Amphidinium_carterae.1
MAARYFMSKLCPPESVGLRQAALHRAPVEPAADIMLAATRVGMGPLHDDTVRSSEQILRASPPQCFLLAQTGTWGPGTSRQHATP